MPRAFRCFRRARIGLLRCLVVAVFLLPSNSFAFPDVPQASPFANAIAYVADAGIMTGFDGGVRFGPNDTLSRAELLKIVMAAKYPEEQLNECLRRFHGMSFAFFRDVPINSWFAPHVCMAQKEGIVRGFSDGTFRPAQKVSFVEVAKIVGMAFGIRSNEGGGEWFRPFVLGLQELGAIPTSIRTFDSRVTRGEIAELIYRLEDKKLNLPSKSFAELQAGFVAAPCNNCLVIDKLGIQVPIIFDIGADTPLNDWRKLENIILRSLRDGVVHYPRTALPGYMGNVFITGHSSYYQSDPGKYKDVFARLTELEVGDAYVVYHNNKKYTYRIYEDKIVWPQEVNVLDQPQDREISSLMTCWPVNTNRQRRIFVAERIE